MNDKTPRAKESVPSSGSRSVEANPTALASKREPPVALCPMPNASNSAPLAKPLIGSRADILKRLQSYGFRDNAKRLEEILADGPQKESAIAGEEGVRAASVITEDPPALAPAPTPGFAKAGLSPSDILTLVREETTIISTAERNPEAKTNDWIGIPIPTHSLKGDSGPSCRLHLNPRPKTLDNTPISSLSGLMGVVFSDRDIPMVCLLDDWDFEAIQRQNETHSESHNFERKKIKGLHRLLWRIILDLERELYKQHRQRLSATALAAFWSSWQVSRYLHDVGRRLDTYIASKPNLQHLGITATAIEFVESELRSYVRRISVETGHPGAEGKGNLGLSASPQASVTPIPALVKAESATRELRAKRERMLADAQARWPRLENGKVTPFTWVHESAGVDHKEAYVWKSGKLPDTSVMSENIETILQQLLPPKQPQAK